MLLELIEVAIPVRSDFQNMTMATIRETASADRGDRWANESGGTDWSEGAGLDGVGSTPDDELVISL